MGQPKKTSTLAEWFYIALLLTAVRPPDHHQLSSLLPYRRSLLPNLHFGIDDRNNGPISVENFYYNDDIHSLHLNGISHNQHFRTKSSILLSETLDILDDLNSLGRYSNLHHHPDHHSSNLIAFPVSGGFSSNVFIKQENDEIGNHLSSSNVNLNYSNNDDNSSLSIDPDILNQIDFELRNYPFNDDDTIWPNLNDDPLIQAENYSSLFNDDIDNNNNERHLEDGSIDDNGNESKSNENDQQQQREIIEDNNNNVDESFDEFLLGDQILPILGSGDNGDVNDLFDELELLLSNETDSYGGSHPEWPSYNGYQSNPTPATATDENGPEYPIYDITQNCNLYEQGSNGQLLNNCSGPYYCNNNSSNNNENENNFGAVLYSSLTTLSNGQDHLNSESSYNGFNNGVTISDANTYMNNVSFPANNSVPDCFYTGYIDEYNNSNNYSTDINHHGQNFEYNSIPTQSTPVTSTPVTQNLLNNNNPEQQQKFAHTNTEDCFDKSSDSAVSSMSSDRVLSLSDNDLIETSSESSSYNCEMNNLPGGNNNSAAKKKYRLFGKNSINSNNTAVNTNEDSGNKNDESKSIVQLTDYYGEYPPINYLYSNSASYSMIDSNDIGQYNSINYYPATAVQHNHTYAQLSNNAPIHSSMSSTSMSCSSSNDWIKQENVEDDSQNENIDDKQKSNRHSKSRTSSISSDKELNHFNRDEKRARALNIPITTEDIINLPIDEFNERLTKYELTEIQLSLIRDIRRRGKNKVAAQNCRKRKLDQIMGLQSEVDTMYSQKGSLESQYNQLLMVREMARDKYNKLYHFVVEASSSRQTFLELSSSPPDFPLKDSSSNEIQINDNSTGGFIVTNATTISVPPVPISSYGIDEFEGQQK